MDVRGVEVTNQLRVSFDNVPILYIETIKVHKAFFLQLNFQ